MRNRDVDGNLRTRNCRPAMAFWRKVYILKFKFEAGSHRQSQRPGSLEMDDVQNLNAMKLRSTEKCQMKYFQMFIQIITYFKFNITNRHNWQIVHGECLLMKHWKRGLCGLRPTVWKSRARRPKIKTFLSFGLGAENLKYLKNEVETKTALTTCC